MVIFNKYEHLEIKSQVNQFPIKLSIKLHPNKPITTFVVLKLIDEGVWSLDDPVSKYFIDEDIKDSKYLNKLTTRHILSHDQVFRTGDI